MKNSQASRDWINLAPKNNWYKRKKRRVALEATYYRPKEKMKNKILQRDLYSRFSRIQKSRSQSGPLSRTLWAKISQRWVCQCTSMIQWTSS